MKMSSDQNPCCLLYIGDEQLPSYIGLFHEPIYIQGSLSTKSVFHGMSAKGFFKTQLAQNTHTHTHKNT